MTSTVQNTATESHKGFAMADLTGGILAALLIVILV